MDPALEALLNPWAGARFDSSFGAMGQGPVPAPAPTVITQEAPSGLVKRGNIVVPVIIVLLSMAVAGMALMKEKRIMAVHVAQAAVLNNTLA